jgi:hypothetical protein
MPPLTAFVLAMLGPPTFEDFVVIATEPDRKLEVVNVIARLDLAEQCRMYLPGTERAIELFGNNAVEVESSLVASVVGIRVS